MAVKISDMAFATTPLDGTEQVELNVVGTGTRKTTSGDIAKAVRTLISALNEAPAVTLASAATVNIGAAAANTINVSGTTTITAFDSIASGAKRTLVFAGALTLTHNATSLILPTGANIVTAAGDTAEFVSLGSGNWRCIFFYRKSGAALSSSVSVIPVAVGDEATAHTTGAAKVTFRMPFAMTGCTYKASLTTAPTGSTLIADINQNGTSVMGTNKLSIDATEKTTATAATAYTPSVTSFADDDEITIDIDQVGSTIAGAGLKVYIIGYV